MRIGNEAGDEKRDARDETCTVGYYPFKIERAPSISKELFGFILFDLPELASRFSLH